MTTLALSVAGLQIEIRGRPSFAVSNAAGFKSCHSSVKKKDICVDIHRMKSDALAGPLLDPESDPLLATAGRRGTASRLLRSRQLQDCLQAARGHTDRLFVEILPEAVSILDFVSNRADFFFIQSSGPDEEPRLIGPALLAPFLPNFAACLLHASAISRNGRAAVFLARNEGGKTTAVRLAATGIVLGDDQVVLRRFGSGFQVAGTPWGLHVNAEIRTPLAGLFLLAKGKGFALEPLPLRDLASHIWEEIKAPLSILPKPLKIKAFHLVCDIAAAVPAWRMTFTRDHIDWQAVDRAMSFRVERVPNPAPGVGACG